MQAEIFLRRVLEACVNKPLILMDKGPWYPNREIMPAMNLVSRRSIVSMPRILFLQLQKA